MNLYLLRHTKVHVPAGTCYGHSDVALASSFSEEREHILKKLEGIVFDKVFSSPLIRCKLLAEAIAANYLLDERLKELNFGDWEGMEWEVISKTPQAQSWFGNFIEEACPAGESYTQLLSRVSSFLGDLKKLQDCENILIVTHGGVIRSFHAIINGMPPERAFDLKIDHGDILVLSVKKDEIA